MCVFNIVVLTPTVSYTPYICVVISNKVKSSHLELVFLPTAMPKRSENLLECFTFYRLCYARDVKAATRARNKKYSKRHR